MKSTLYKELYKSKNRQNSKISKNIKKLPVFLGERNQTSPYKE